MFWEPFLLLHSAFWAPECSFASIVYSMRTPLRTPLQLFSRIILEPTIYHLLSTFCAPLKLTDTSYHTRLNLLPDFFGLLWGILCRTFARNKTARPLQGLLYLLDVLFVLSQCFWMFICFRYVVLASVVIFLTYLRKFAILGSQYSGLAILCSLWTLRSAFDRYTFWIFDFTNQIQREQVSGREKGERARNIVLLVSFTN